MNAKVSPSPFTIFLNVSLYPSVIAIFYLPFSIHLGYRIYLRVAINMLKKHGEYNHF